MPDKKICFIEPPIEFLRDQLDPPFPLMYLAAVAEQQNWQTEIVHMGTLQDKLPEADIYAVTSASPQWPTTLKLSERLANEFPNKLKICGGSHISACPDDVYNSKFNAVVVGEGEIALERILKNPGILYDCKIIKGEPVKDLDTILFPARHLIDWSKYKRGIMLGNKLLSPAVSMITSRGCPYRCIFCLPKGTLVLTEDLTYIPIEQIKTGDILIGVRKGDKYLQYERSRVLDTFKRKDRIYKIKTMNGSVHSTIGHPWLSDHYRWRKTGDFVPGQFLRKVSTPIRLPEETKDYKLGYISGAYDGDGYMGVHDDIYCNYEHYTARLVGDYDMMDTVLQYSNDLKIGLHEASFDGGEWALDSCVVSYKKDVFDYLNKIRLGKDFVITDEYKRGYLAGIYDAEGSWPRNDLNWIGGPNALRICNTDERILNRIAEYLHYFGFQTELDENGKSIRILGGLSKILLFFTLVNPKVEDKKQQIFDYHVKSKDGYAQILDISPGNICDVYNLETTTGNFIADGFITHNCSSHCVFGRRVRFRSVDNVVAEMKHVIDTLGYRGFNFHDDTFCINRVRILNMCKEFTKLNILWRCLTRADSVDRDLLRIMRDSGCREVIIGMESGSQKILNALKKGTTVEQNLRAMKMVKEFMQLKVGIIIGSPGETWETIRETEKLLKECPPDFWNVSTFMPLPGSDAWNNPEKFGLKILTRDLNQYHMIGKDMKGNVVVETEEMSKADLEQARDEIMDILGTMERS